jgi:hypothetical protein
LRGHRRIGCEPGWWLYVRARGFLYGFREVGCCGQGHGEAGSGGLGGLVADVAAVDFGEASHDVEAEAAAPVWPRWWWLG